jgi:dihydrofolate reductase
MPQLQYQCSMSLDGFIAGPGGDASWMVPYLGPNPTVDELTGDVGALLVGNRTFRGDDPYKGTPQEGQAYGGAWSGPQVVVTHHPPDVPVPDMTFATDVPTGIALAKAAAGEKRYVAVLGADVARQCLELGALDEIMVAISPVLLGDGVRLFDHPGGAKVPLERIRLTEAPHATNIWLRIVR